MYGRGGLPFSLVSSIREEGKTLRAYIGMRGRKGSRDSHNLGSELIFDSTPTEDEDTAQ